MEEEEEEEKRDLHLHPLLKATMVVVMLVVCYRSKTEERGRGLVC